ncbi:ferrochelatase [Brevundimonas sp. GW460-12-10-14-LB2]|jgi:ferrochelatase|uniref:ferrochelatase n=1 Tax=Brevundimonas sp. GW460-12-10-14-LB2 TaxID=1827469 RepID=UPI0007BCBEEE|nr:ferrochelatase [Brevundimonas sp. GW460-12-10-14-LB2]ANC54604.1 ferrochelatase [Brevundimonas sp. GW460-12-10-14-LB2]MEA3473670.1 ferrochelatase [Pseudomonadota bacterium]
MSDANPGRRIAVVLFNLGGPDDQASVKPFLFNLFNDPAIIGLPGIFRTPLAKLISSRRETSAQANYALMGGGSPLLPETSRQAEALQAVLGARLGGDEVKVFIAMRYWHPLTEETAAEVAAFGPDEVVLLPLYPQFSTTTTESSLKAWNAAYAGPGVSRAVCCYPAATGWVEAQAQAIGEKLDEAVGQPVRVLFSAHGIPEKLVTGKGDPYQEQIETTVAAVVAAIEAQRGPIDHAICYQSRVGPMKWLGPSTPEAIETAAKDGVGVVVTPIAFVSEHIETLVELDIEYGELAHEKGASPYLRAPAVGIEPLFIDALADAAVGALSHRGVAPFGQGCKADWKACPHRKARQAA